MYVSSRMFAQHAWDPGFNPQSLYVKRISDDINYVMGIVGSHRQGCNRDSTILP